jgi:hypothetical protein
VRLRATETQPQICGGGFSRRKAAKMFAVSLRSVEKAAALIRAVEKGRAIAELLIAVRNGNRRLHLAEKLSRATLEQQREALAPRVNRAFSASSFDQRRWDHAADQIAGRIINPTRSALGLAVEAHQARKLTPQRWKRLVDSCRESLRILRVTTEEIERFKMPFGDE